ncbi:hypothetical protein MBANPS3_010828 [Mucor bainieri]
MKATEVPHEILKHIFYYLEEKEFPDYIDDGEEEVEDFVKGAGTLLQLQLTCKLWSQAAREVFYGKVDLAGSSRKTTLFLRTLQSASDIGQAVKQVTISDASFNDNVSFASVVKLCPNLKALLQWDESDMDIFTPSLALYQEGYLQKLEKVSLPSMLYCGSTLFQQYNQLMLAAKQTITNLYLSQASQFALADHLKEFINLRELRLESNKTLTLQQLSSMLKDNCPHLQSIDVESAAPSSVNEQQPSAQSLLHALNEYPQIKSVELELCPLSVQDLRRIQRMFPKVSSLFVNRRSASFGPASNGAIVQAGDPDMVFDRFVKYLSIIKQFYVGSITVSFKDLLAALTVVSKYFQVCHVSIEIVEHPYEDQHDLLIASAENFERITVGHGEKPNCGIGLQINRSQIDDAFCQDLYKTLARKTAPLGMVIIGRLAPQNKYLGNHLGYLLVHCPSLTQLTMYNLSIDIPPLADTDNPTSIMQFQIMDSTITPGTLQEVSRKLRLVNVVKLDKVQVLDAATDTLTHLMEINMPHSNIGSLIFYDGRSNYSKNIIFKVELTSGTLCYFVDATGWAFKLSRNAYLNRQKSTKTKVPEFIIRCDDLGRIITTVANNTTDAQLDKTWVADRAPVFSKSYCPYCLDAKDLLDELNIAYKAIELDQDPLGYVIQQTLSDMTGQWTVPNIFIHATSIGGCDDLNALHIKGKLEEMVAASEYSSRTEKEKHR